MRNPKTYSTAIGRGFDFLLKAQQPDGGFESFMCQAGTLDTLGSTTSTTVLPALILSALARTKQSRASAITDKLATWLLSQKSASWTFPYWTIDADKAYDRLLTANLHSTFLALTALYQHNPDNITSDALGNIAKLLINAESEIGGPYYTYAHVIARTTRPQIDIATNSNIGYFLAQVADPLPKLTAHLEQAIHKEVFLSRLFTSPYATMYQIASLAAPDQRQQLAGFILDRRTDEAWGNALDTAFALATLAILDVPRPDSAIKRLLAMQLPDGSWAGRGCFIAPDTQSYGSAALTTALAIQALSSQAQKRPVRQKPTSRPSKTSDTSTALYDATLALARQEMQTLGLPLRRHGLHMINHISQRDENREIVLMGYFFTQSLQTPPATIDRQFLTHLGAANLYNWIAYTIYDDFLDDEGDPMLLSVANVAMRYSLEHFRQALPAHKRFQRAVKNVFDTIDAANTWEVKYCRFHVQDGNITISSLPRYGRRSRLAERSCSHSLPAMAVLANITPAIDASAAVACYTAFKHYLIARQLNDDMHDWEEDVAAGRITYVVSAIMEDLHLTPGVYNMASLLADMRQQFWDYTLERICGDVARHTAHSRRAAVRSGVLSKQNIFTQLLDPLDSVTAFSMSERNKANAFLDAYRESPERP